MGNQHPVKRTTVSPPRGSQIYVEKISPHGFSSVADTIEEALEAIQKQIKSMIKTADDVTLLQTVCDKYLLGVDGAYFVVDIIKTSKGNKYQANVMIRI